VAATGTWGTDCDDRPADRGRNHGDDANCGRKRSKRHRYTLDRASHHDADHADPQAPPENAPDLPSDAEQTLQSPKGQLLTAGVTRTEVDDA
jgi:hypothetical protein